MKGKKIVICLKIIFLLYSIVFCNNVEAKTMNFKDVSKEDWYYEAVLYNYRSEIILGLNDTTYAPENKFTRGMLVTIIHRMENEEIVSLKNKFPDVFENDYYYEAVKWATEKGIIHGYGDGTFKPNKNITREEILVILRNYSEYKGLNVNIDYFNCRFMFGDGSKVSSYAIESVEWAISKGIITGYSNDNTIKPQATATRAEASSIIYKYCSRHSGYYKKLYKITPSENNITVENGLYTPVTVTFSNYDLANYNIRILKDNKSIVDISWEESDSGEIIYKIYGKAEGNCVITITDYNISEVFATINVTVTPKVSVTGITINKEKSDIKINRRDTLIATIFPDNAQDKYIYWESSDESVVKIGARVLEDSGNEIIITGVSEGTATVTATSHDGSFKASCKVTVTPLEVESVKITTDVEMNYYTGDTLQLKYRTFPSDATNQNVVWKSSNPSVASVDENGLVTVHGHVGNGIAYITVTTEDGNYSDKVQIYCAR